MRTSALLLPPLLLAALLALSLPTPAAAQEGLTPELAYRIKAEVIKRYMLSGLRDAPSPAELLQR
jgi:hypothetical protein